MLKVTNLTKKYVSKEGTTFALDNVNLEFNKNEFVFVVGKSGSGKSTLLNILGSLDKATSGEVLINDESLNSFNKTKTNIYRQNIAFIFQDFALIDNLNVKDNIKLARSDVTDEDIKAALQRVELSNFENRKIGTLSAGQKQRVAIARGIVKNPRIILCDEPTGNLDFLTSQSIIKCLKNLTKDSLVLFVSHNLDDAYTYANRIIELDNGHVSKDIEINEGLEDKPYVVEDNSLYLTTIKSLDEQEINKINDDINSGKINKIYPKQNLFKEHENKEANDINIGDKYKKIKSKDLFSFSNKVLRKQFVKTSLFALISALVLSVFSIAFSFITFDPQDYTKRSLDKNDETHLSFKQDAKDTQNIDEYNRILPLSPNFYEQVEGEKYVDYFPTINIPIPGVSNVVSVGPYANTYPADSTCILKGRQLCFNNSCGVMVIPEQQFSTYLNGGRPFEIIEEAEEKKDYGVYITDVAANWAKRDHKTYLGEKKSLSYPNKDYRHGTYINGVVKTNLEDLFPEFKDYLYKDVLSKEEYYSFTHHDNYQRFLRAFSRCATYFYSFNADFLNKFLDVERDFRWLTNYRVGLEACNKYIVPGSDETLDDYLGAIERGNFTTSVESSIPRGYCNVSIGLLNKYMHEEGEHTKEEWQDILDQYGRKIYIHNAVCDVDGYNHPVFTLEIRNISDSEGAYIATNHEDANEINRTSFFEYGIASFDSGFYTKNETLFTSLHIKTGNTFVTIGTSISKTIGAYKGLFEVVFYITLIAAVFLAFVAAYDAIKKQTYSIGVMKSLGVRESSIFGCFAVHQVEFILLSGLLALIAEVIFLNIANNILVLALQGLFSLKVRPVIPILEFTGPIYLVSFGIIVVTTILSLVLSFILVKKMRIVDILKNKY